MVCFLATGVAPLNFSNIAIIKKLLKLAMAELAAAREQLEDVAKYGSTKSKRKKLKIRESLKGEYFVEGLTEQDRRI